MAEISSVANATRIDKIGISIKNETIACYSRSFVDFVLTIF